MKDRKRIRDSQETEETAHVLSSSSTTSKEGADHRKSWEKVDEKMILDTYEASLEMEEDEMESGSEYITGKRAKAIVEAALSTQG